MVLRDPALGIRSELLPREILEPLQTKFLLTIVNAPWYLPNALIRGDLGSSSVKGEIPRYSARSI